MSIWIAIRSDGTLEIADIHTAVACSAIQYHETVIRRIAVRYVSDEYPKSTSTRQFNAGFEPFDLAQVGSHR